MKYMLLISPVCFQASNQSGWDVFTIC